MNRNILKWVLIAAVIIGAAAYFILSEMPSGQRQGKQGKEKIVVGNSKPFKIEPVEGITISAPKNALDKDRKIEVSPVDDKTWDKLESTIAEVSGMQMILGLKVSAGLKAGESTPGVITCQYDLKKMGIPEILYDYITVWHVGEDGDAYKYTSWMEGDRLTFHTDQNPFITLAVPSLAAVGTTLAITVVAAPFLIYGGETVMKYLSNSDLYSYYFFENSDAAIYNVKDKYGDFHILFRFRDTEEANRHDEFVAANEKAVIRLKELSTLAKKEYDRKVDSLYAIEMKKMKDVWSRLVQSSAAYERSKAAIDQAAIFVKKQKEDAEYQLLLKKMQPPKSIADIGEMLKAANRFLTKDQLMKPQTRDLEVDLIDAAHAGTSNAEYRHGLTKSPYMIVKYDKKKPGAQYSRFGDSANESLLISVNHELFHHREKIMKFMDFRTEETFAAYNEKVASAYFREHNELTLPDNDLNFAPRTDHQAYCMSFSSKYFGKPHLAYVYANLMDSLQVYTKSKSIKGSKLMDRYSYLSSYKSNYMSWFSIKDEALFEDYLMRFFKGSLEWIATAQQNNVAETPELKRQECIVSKDKPIQKIDAAKGDYIMRAVDIQTKVMANNPDEAFNAFIIPESGYKKGELRFCWNFGQGVAQESMYLSNGTQGDNFYQLGYFKISSGKRTFTVVVLFKPEAPEIRKVKEDQVTFIVPKPARSLTKEKLITGVVVTYKDKNGEELTREIEPKNFGKKATWTIPGCSKKGNSFTLSAHWYYKPDEQTTYVSPESEPAQWGAKGDEPEEEEMVLTKEPETNYWKQVSSRMTMKNTSIDVDESNDDEVSSDYRSIDLQAAKTGRSLEFSGMGATEEKTKENGRVYVQDIFIEGTLTYTEPPKFWIPTQQYKAHWEIADDPYLTKVSDPFVFEAKNTSSDQAACAQSKKDKIDNGRSSVGKVNWLRGSTTTFEARHPEKNGPKSFTLTQTYSIKERQGSDLMATVTFVYNYEWVGEEEPEPEVEEENNSQIQLIGIGGGGCLRYHYNTHKQDHEGPLFSLYKDGDGYKLKGTRDSYENFCVEIRLDNKMIPVSGFYKVTAHQHYLSKQNENYAGSFGDFKLTEKNRHEYGMQYIYYGKMTSYDADVFENVSEHISGKGANFVKKHKTLTDLSNTDVRIELVLEK